MSETESTGSADPSVSLTKRRGERHARRGLRERLGNIRLSTAGEGEDSSWLSCEDGMARSLDEA